MKIKEMPMNSAHSYPTMIASNEKITSSQCPQCGTTSKRHAHYCSKCGASLTVCARCRSTNVSFGCFCHMCGQSLIFARIHKIAPWEGRDLGVLDQAVLAIIKLRGGLISVSEAGAALDVSTEEIIDSVERLESAYRIERTES